MFKKEPLILCFVLLCFKAEAQQLKSNSLDSLSSKSYDYISKSVAENNTDTGKAKIYAQAWVTKAKQEKEFNQLTQAYKALLYTSEKKHWLQYADSMVASANKTSDNILMGTAYMTKAAVYYDRGTIKTALDNFIIADKYIVKTPDKNAIFEVKFGIAQTKYYLGFYDEAMALFKQCIEYFKEENDRAYLNSLHALGVCYNKVGNISLSSITNRLGINEGKRLENRDMQPYFIQSEGVNQWAIKKYKEAILNLNNTLPYFLKNQDFATVMVTYCYIGKCYWQLNERDKAITYFKKVDALYNEHNYIRPDVREGYELLIDYYKKTNDKELQLLYIDKLLTIDQLLHQNYRYLLKKIIKEYDTRKLLEAKKDIEDEMNFRTAIGVCILAMLLMVIGLLINRQQKNKRLFRELMNRNTNLEPSKKEDNESKPFVQELIPETENSILKQLEKFERTKKYLEKDMTLVKMASILNTNTKYVSKVIVKHKGTGTIEYINKLKIDYIIEKLKTESKYRNYTNKALGEEAGFGTTQIFTRTFKAQTGISPTFFIYQLKKATNTDSLD